MTLGSPGCNLHQPNRKEMVLLGQQLLRKKPFPNLSRHAGEDGLSRNISLLQLTLMGVGSTLGTGIFFALAETVPMAGPAVVLAFVLAAITAGLSALCYAEVSSALPVSGSSYTFTYVTLGEGVAMAVASCLLLEWGIGAAATSVGWSSYLNDLVTIVSGHEISAAWSQSPLDFGDDGLRWDSERVMNLPAVVLVWMCTALLLRGSHESAMVNAVLTLIKLAVLVMFVVMSLQAFDVDNFTPFMPSGVSGVGSAAAVVFFSFIGLDAVVNASEEAIHPRRNVPRAIIMALAIVTGFYVLVASSSLGVQPASDFVGRQGNLTQVLQRASGLPWLSGVLAMGAVISIFSVTLICIYGQSRILFAMARDRILPPRLAAIDHDSHSPRAGVLACAWMITPLAGWAPAHLLWSMVSLGTLVTFIAVAVSLMLLRSHHQLEHAGYHTPAYPLVPILSIMSCVYLLTSLSSMVFQVMLVWLALAALIYLFYSRHRAAPTH